MTEQDKKQDNSSEKTDPAAIDGLAVVGGAKRPIVTSDEAAAEPAPAANQPTNPLPSATSDIHIHITINNPVLHIKTLNIGAFEEEE